MRVSFFRSLLVMRLSIGTLVRLSIPLFVTALMVGCNQEGEDNKDKSGIDGDSAVAQVKPEAPTSPLFSGDTAYILTKTQVDFGPRAMNTAGHEKCGKWLESQLRETGGTVTVQRTKIKAWDGKMLDCANYIAAFAPERKERVALFAHWDTRPWADQDLDSANWDKPILGANDGASGVAVLLQIAKILGKKLPPNVGVDIILVDAEDYGLSEKGGETYGLGTQYWAKNPHVKGYTAKYGILLDMVGAPNTTFPYEGTSVMHARNVVDKVWGVGGSLGYGQFFTYLQGMATTDDHAFINELTQPKIPTIDIIHIDYTTGEPQGTFAPYWHTLADDMRNIDPKTLGAVGQTVLETIWREK